jgi:signal transduction histidine kinase
MAASQATARRLPLAAPERVDVLLALVVVAVSLLDLVIEEPPEATGLAVFGALATALPLVWRSTVPAAAALGATAGLMIVVAFGSPDDQPVVTAFAPLIGLFALGEHGSTRALRFAGPLAVLAWSSAGLFEHDAGSTVFGLFASAGAILVGRAVRVMSFETDVLEAQVGSLQEDHERRAREAVAAERERIARELHDVIGHSISVMGVQAGAVRRVLPPELENEREMLMAIERTGRDSVEEMRRLIDLLRETDDVPDAALPSLARVKDLVEDVRRAGLDVRLEVAGDVGDLPPGRSLAGYRIVQEALTNALKHSPASKVVVSIGRAGPDVELAVESSPDASAEGSAHRDGGRGLIGMRERAAIYGGTLDAGSTADGGFRVTARLPGEGA